MKRAALLFAALTMFAIVVSGQTCKPVTINMNQHDAIHDTGTGPNVTFGIQQSGFSAQVPANLTYFTTNRVFNFGPDDIDEWIAVYGGCNQAFSAGVLFNAKLHDVTAGSDVWATTQTGSSEEACGTTQVSYCHRSFMNNQIPTTQYTLADNHTFQFHDFEQAGTNLNIGLSPNYDTVMDIATGDLTDYNNYTVISGALDTVGSDLTGAANDTNVLVYLSKTTASNQPCSSFGIASGPANYSSTVSAGPTLTDANGNKYQATISLYSLGGGFYGTQVQLFKNATALTPAYQTSWTAGDHVSVCSSPSGTSLVVNMYYNSTTAGTYTDSQQFTNMFPGAFFANGTSNANNGWLASQLYGF